MNVQVFLALCYNSCCQAVTTNATVFLVSVGADFVRYCKNKGIDRKSFDLEQELAWI